jgi:hypothetical protein
MHALRANEDQHAAAVLQKGGQSGKAQPTTSPRPAGLTLAWPFGP